MSERKPISPIRVEESLQAVESQHRKRRQAQRKIALAIGGSLPLLIIVAPIVIFIALNRWSGENQRLWTTFQASVAEYDCCQRGVHGACAEGIHALKSLHLRLKEEPTMSQRIAQQVSPYMAPDGFFAGPEFDVNHIESLVEKCALASITAD
jgi:hypothetical protein